MLKKITDWIDERIQIREVIESNLTGYKVPANLNFWYSMGSVLLAMLFIQFVTGILLLIYYVPHVDKAFESVTYITNKAPFGWLIRRVHAMAANIFIAVLFLHMLSTLFMGSYKKPRELQWMSGLVLFALGLLAALSGYLLPWSQLSYWATTVATNTVSAVPFIGDELVRWVRGAERVEQATLGRFFALHVMVVPLLFLGLVAAHLFGMRRTGISAPPGTKKEDIKKIPFVPNFALEDLKVIYFFLGILFIFVFFYPQLYFPHDALKPADPFFTPPHIKPEWYFLANYETLKLIPSKILGVFIPLLVALFLFLLPLVDTGSERQPLKRPVFLTIAIIGVLVFIALSVLGEILK
ncbi:MAG: cytochrome b [Ignavibacteriales bacterium]|jgi:ubiquinol-cytochrome c reductase cytochrome b subunit